ncbi:hypothetical protein PAXINDRAFT_12997 [Paxillus involutus ATCC 200175]|uniref:Uncharacterized protein n=1 Tax=Paxillus involutus ATCC 200175 TaxID=664439 RepID=A0A0C9U4C4_PAXIN|nr:hypothetical protein PAXINDRAFT_12997 [Paxillus involutus ATCC 200175]
MASDSLLGARTGTPSSSTPKLARYLENGNAADDSSTHPSVTQRQIHHVRRLMGPRNTHAQPPALRFHVLTHPPDIRLQQVHQANGDLRPVPSVQSIATQESGRSQIHSKVNLGSGVVKNSPAPEQPIQNTA